MIARLGVVLLATVVLSAADSHHKVEKMFISRTVKSDQKPSAAGYYFSSDSDGPDKYLEIGTDDTLQPVQSFSPEEEAVPRRYTASVSSAGTGYIPLSYVGSPNVQSNDYSDDGNVAIKHSAPPADYASSYDDFESDQVNPDTYVLSGASFDSDEYKSDAHQGVKPGLSDVHLNFDAAQNYADKFDYDTEYDKLASDIANFIYSHTGDAKDDDVESDDDDSDDEDAKKNDDGKLKEYSTESSYSDGSSYSYSTKHN